MGDLVGGVPLEGTLEGKQLIENHPETEDIGAMVEADLLGGSLGAALREAAASAFGAGVGVTAAMGAALVVVAAVIAAATLGGSRAPSRFEH